jgi:AraC-like DNA-binding protein
MRHCTGERLVPLRVRHQLGKRAESAYEGFYGIKPLWNADESQMWFRRADLAKPFRGASSELASLLAEHAPRLMTPGQTSSSSDADFESAFWTQQQRGNATLETVAEALDVSARTLQRRLADAGTTFAERRAVILRNRAQLLLASDDVAIETIAERLGYSTRSAFERAFFRWTGQTPHAVRRDRAASVPKTTDA